MKNEVERTKRKIKANFRAYLNANQNSALFD